MYTHAIHNCAAQLWQHAADAEQQTCHNAYGKHVCRVGVTRSSLSQQHTVLVSLSASVVGGATSVLTLSCCFSLCCSAVSALNHPWLLKTLQIPSQSGNLQQVVTDFLPGAEQLMMQGTPQVC